MKKIFTSPWLAVVTLMVVVALRVWDPSFVESVRLRYFDTLILSKPPQSNNIVVAHIDEDTVQAHGQWPFARDVYASMIEQLFARGAKLVVWNVLMPEEDRMGKDSSLADTLARHPVVLSNIPSHSDKNTPRKPGSAVIHSEFSDRLLQHGGIIANVTQLETPAAGIGTTHTLPEIDGVNRRIPLLSVSAGRLFPSLALETVRVLSADKMFQVRLNELGVEKLRIPRWGYIETDSLGRIWIDWSSRSENISMAHLPHSLQDKIVIVGTSAAGIANPVATSRGAVWPQDLQATVLSTLLDRVSIQRPSWADGAELLLLVMGGLVVIAVSGWTWAFVPVLMVLGTSHFAAQWAYAQDHILIDITAFVAAITLTYMHAYTAKFVSEFLQKQQIKRQFGTYLSPALVAKLQKNPELLRLGGESRELSIMFTDVRGFTSISEHYGTNVQGLTQIMNRYMTAMTAKILENQGTLDKYIGDAQMAFWNAPLDDPHHAKHAVRTALAMLGDLKNFNDQIAQEGVPAFGMGLGINTAEVVVGNMGSSQRFDYTCLGDGVNLASRLEGQSKPYGVKLVIGPLTAQQVSDEFEVVELDEIAVKGKTQGVRIHTVLGTRNVNNRKYQTAHEQHKKFLDCYRNQRWQMALTMARSLTNAWDGQLHDYYVMMMERCRQLQSSPPGPNWDGVYRATSK
jgi:adenylate cyclase